MKKLNKEFEFTLENDVEYQYISKDSGSSEIRKNRKLLLKAPANKHRDQVFALRQGLLRALNNLQASSQATQKPSEQTNSNSIAEIDGHAMLAGLFMSDINMNEYMEIFEKLLLNGCGLLGGETILTETLLKNISLDDLEKALGEYVANFIFPSWMKAQQRK